MFPDPLSFAAGRLDVPSLWGLLLRGEKKRKRKKKKKGFPSLTTKHEGQRKKWWPKGPMQA